MLLEIRPRLLLELVVPGAAERLRVLEGDILFALIWIGLSRLRHTRSHDVR